MSGVKNEPDLGDYTDYLLLSSSEFTQGWKHNIMRLAPASSADVTDPTKWSEAKLNRRDMRRIRREEEQMARQAAEKAAAAKLKEQQAKEGGEGNGDVKMEGGELAPRPGMPGYTTKVEPKEERDESLIAPGPSGVSSSKPTTSSNRPRRGFGAPKKTRRVYITEESSKERRIHFEEQHPWMLETTVDEKASTSGRPGQDTTRWMGKMDAAASAVANGGEGSSYALFVLDTKPGSEAAFKVVPANRWYKFSSRPRYATLTAEDAEQEYTKMQKSGDMDLWFASRRVNPTPPTSATTGAAQAGRTVRGPDSFMSNGTAQSGGYKSRFAEARGSEANSARTRGFRTVVNDELRGDDDADDYEPAGTAGKRAGKASVKPKRRAGLADDEYEEFDFEEDFQDDEEGIGQVGDEAIEEEDTKELEERIKKEMRAANNFGDGVEDADEDDGVRVELTKAGKRVKKILKKRGRKGKPEDEEDEDDLFSEDDDDDLRNPYASEEEEEEEDSDVEREKKAKEQEEAKKRQPQYPGQVSGQPHPGTLSRSGSSAPRYPGASPAMSRAPSTNGSRAVSPAPAGSSKPLKRAGSPASRAPSRGASPTPPPSATKRKADDRGASPSAVDTSSAGASTKRRKPGSPSPAPAPVVPVAPGDDSALIPREDIIAYIKAHAPTTKELLKHYKAAMTRDPRNKDVILEVVRGVATIVDGKLAIKPGAA